MPKRLLIGAVVALGSLSLLNLVVLLLDGARWGTFEIAGAPVPVLDIVCAALAMGAGAVVARDRRFRWVALGLLALSWALTLSVMRFNAPPVLPEELRTLAGLLRYNAAAIVLTLAAAWLGAFAGERFAGPRSPFRTAAP